MRRVNRNINMLKEARQVKNYKQSYHTRVENYLLI
jgi:hypothetical protein